jgi:hemolysin III
MSGPLRSPWDARDSAPVDAAANGASNSASNSASNGASNGASTAAAPAATGAEATRAAANAATSASAHAPPSSPASGAATPVKRRRLHDMRLALAALLVERPQTLGEEIANAISHGIGFLLAVASLPVLVFFAVQHGSTVNVVAVSIYALTMMLLYFISALYHALPAGSAKQWFNRLDHAAIYIFIAGSYTPFALGVLHGSVGWAMFGVVWGLAALGVAAKLFNRLKHPLWSTGLYVAMGWVALLAVVPMTERMSTAGLAWLVAGGVAYTAGAVVFLFDSRMRYVHSVWHLFVLGGSTCHFFAVLWHSA